MKKPFALNRILFATDFSPAAQNASEFAVLLAKAMGLELQLLHIIPEIPGAEDFKQLMQMHPHFREVADRLQHEARRIIESEGIPTGFLMKEGNIFDHIGEAAAEVNARLIVMATHGLSGIQYLTGSFAGKVISRASTPVCVVQGASVCAPFKHIWIAPDFTRPVAPLLGWAILMADAFQARIRVIVDQETGILESMKYDLSFEEFRRRLEDSGHIFRVQTVKATGKAFYKELLDAAAKSEAPVVLAELNRKRGKAAYGPEHQLLITNPAYIPVICLPKD